MVYNMDLGASLNFSGSQTTSSPAEVIAGALDPVQAQFLPSHGQGVSPRSPGIGNAVPRVDGRGQQIPKIQSPCLGTCSKQIRKVFRVGIQCPGSMSGHFS